MTIARSLLRQRPVTASSAELSQLAAELRANPCFLDATMAYTRSILTFRRNGPRLVNKLLGHDTRYRVFFFTLYLHQQRDPAFPETGATFSRLQDLMDRSIGSSTRIINTTISLMQTMGLVELRPSPVDRRIKVLLGTPRLEAMALVWLDTLFGALDILDPLAKRKERLQNDKALLVHTTQNVGKAYLDGESLTGHASDLFCFIDRDCGWPMLGTAYLAAREGVALPSLGAIARNYGASKSQIAQIKGEAIKKGFFTEDESGVWASPTLLAAYEAWLSVLFAFITLHSASPNGVLTLPRRQEEQTAAW